jgi:hypothetical protein
MDIFAAIRQNHSRHDRTRAKFEKQLPQQNLWVILGSGNAPSVW